MIGDTCDYTVKSIFTIIFTHLGRYIQGCDAPQSLLLPGCRPLLYYHLLLYRALQTKLTEVGGGCRAALPIQKVKTSSSPVTCVPLPVASPRPSCARHHAQKHSQANKHKRECQGADNVFFSLSSMTSRSNWFCFCETLYFSNFQPCLKLLNYIPTCQDSSAGHSSKG